MSRYLDAENWGRWRQFEFFKDYHNPFFNICASVEVGPLLEWTRARGDVSFFVAYHFCSMKAANEVEPFRYRLRGDRVLVHDRIHAGTTILVDDENFSFVFFDYDDDFEVFHARALESIERAKTAGVQLNGRADRDDLIHHSVIPWATFTSISHARRGTSGESVPKIAFGKYRADAGRTTIPISVEAHHALMDGLHVGRYFQRLETYFTDPPSALGRNKT